MRSASGVFLDLACTAVDGREKARNNAPVGEGLAAAHGMGFASASYAVCEKGYVVAFEKVFDGG